MNSKPIDILGLRVQPYGLKAAVKDIVHAAQTEPKAGYVVRPHVEFLDRALQHPDIMKLLNNARFSLVDGVALQWAAYYLNKQRRNPINLFLSLGVIPFQTRKLKSVIKERISGTTFTHALLSECQSKNAKVFLIGNPQKVAIKKTATFLQKKYPDLEIIGTYSAKRIDAKRITISGAQAKELKNILLKLKPDVILVGLGFPRQEQLMSSLCSQLDHGIFIGEGGTFDYKDFGGHIWRAPKALRKSGLEWSWRLIRQPKRIKRQLAIPRFIWRVYKWPKN